MENSTNNSFNTTYNIFAGDISIHGAESVQIFVVKSHPDSDHYTGSTEASSNNKDQNSPNTFFSGKNYKFVLVAIGVGVLILSSLFLLHTQQTKTVNIQNNCMPKAICNYNYNNLNYEHSKDYGIKNLNSNFK